MINNPDLIAKRLLEGKCWHEMVKGNGKKIRCKCKHNCSFTAHKYCPESPDNICHYYVSYGKNLSDTRYHIITVNREKYYLPEEMIDKNFELREEQYCIFCGRLFSDD